MKINLIRLSIILMLALIWQVMAVLVGNVKVVPGFGDLIRVAYPTLSNFSDSPGNSLWSPLFVIFHHSLLSVYRIIAGSLIGIIVGSGIAIVIVSYKKYSQGNLLVLNFCRSIPLLAFIPLFYYWFGGREIGMILYIAFAVAIIFATGLYHSLLNIPPAYLQQARILGTADHQMFRYVFRYAILPEMYGTVINLAGLTWAISLAAEYLAGNSGLGYLIFMSYYHTDMGHLILLSLVYCLWGVLTYISVKYFFKPFIKWI